MTYSLGSGSDDLLYSSKMATVIIGCLLLAQIAIYWPSWNSMREVWDTPTYTHGYLVPFVSLYLAWRQRHRLARSMASPWPLALLGVFGCGVLWLAGNLAGVNAAQHFAILGMLVCLVALVFGIQITRKLAFPLAFLMFAVPFGDFMLPFMMDWTAAITIALVRASGVPIYREGLSFMLPTGSWSVVEECSGQRYLIAALPLACIFAYTSFRLNRTRVLFVLFTIATALVANWIRAYLIVMLGHLSGMSLATGVDHLIYGWMFFGLVMALVFWVGSHWREPDALAADPDRSAPAFTTQPVLPRVQGVVRPLLLGAMGLLLLGVWPVASHQLTARQSPALDLVATFSDQGLSIPKPDYSQGNGFRPAYSGMRDELYAEIQDKQAMLWVGKFEAQGAENEMIGANQIANSRPSQDGWRITDIRTAGSSIAGTRPSEYELSRGSERLIVWQWFCIDGVSTRSPLLAKLLTAVRVARGRGDQSLAIFLWTSADDQINDSRARLERSSKLIADALARTSMP